MSGMSPQTGQGTSGASAAATPRAVPSVPVWPRSRRVRNAAGRLFWALWWTYMAVSPTKPVAEYPALRVLAVVFVVTSVVQAFGELRVRVLLEHDGLVIARAVRRTRIPWADVTEVRVRGLTMGRGWVEVVRRNSREVVLPTPVEAYAVLKDQWERATAASPGTGRLPVWSRA